MKYILLTILTLLLTGCLTFEQTIRFNHDSTILASYVYTYQEAYENILKTGISKAIATNPNGTIDFFNEKGISAYCNAQGLELRQYKRTAKNGTCTVQIIILARKSTPDSLAAIGGFIQHDRRIEMLLPALQWPKQIQQDIAKLCPDLTLSLTLVAPDKITSSNGKLRRPDTASWIFTPKNGLFDKERVLYIEW